MNQQPTQGMGKPQITPELLRNAPNIQCECGGLIFQEKLFFKKISAIISPSGKEEVAPMPIIVCESCGKVPSAFDTQNVLPPEIKADGNKRSLAGDLVVDGYIYATGDVRIGKPTDPEWAEKE
jgi:hypothetical protein